MKLDAQAGRSYEMQVSGDLAAWSFLTNIVATESVTTLKDQPATNLSSRFYRVVVP
jgi:hypothetical protein